jgi:hypothetical protein
VYVSSSDGGTLIKSGGIIANNTSKNQGRTVSLNNTQNRNADVGPDLNFTTGVDSGWWD